jgi:hypothetical protein
MEWPHGAWGPHGIALHMVSYIHGSRISTISSRDFSRGSPRPSRSIYCVCPLKVVILKYFPEAPSLYFFQVPTKKTFTVSSEFS